MAVLRCTVCGGELEVDADRSVGVCKYCDSTIVIPKELGRRGNLYNRAIFLRQNNEFDKAVAAYEAILEEDNEDAEAHWGLTLSKFGIEYVSDPNTKELIPTCHRTQADPILSDPDYLAALKYADAPSRQVMEQEARRIGAIQSKILEISRNEPPYDIFICYKESDERGNRTEDSVLAQDLYYELRKKDYRVFFARKTLEKRLGEEYEPIIFAALHSAKIMIVLGTKPEHFQAVWVRNEWSRFRKLSRNSHKVIIPAYRGMPPYELPVELSSLQSQDMSKLGFMQDLTDGIERILRGDEERQEEPEEIPAAEYYTVPVERLLKNGRTYLGLENYSEAEKAYTTVTKEFPEEYEGWWGLIVSKTKEFAEIVPDPSQLNSWFGYARRLAGPGEFAKLERVYLEYIYRIADSDAEKDMENVNYFVANYHVKMNSLERYQEITNKRMQENRKNFMNQQKETDIKIYELENELTERVSRTASYYHKSRALLFCGFCICGIIFINTNDLGMGLIFFLLAFLINPWLFEPGGPFIGGMGKLQIQAALKQVNNAKKADREFYDNTIASDKAELIKCDTRMADLRKSIADCEKYLNLGKNAIQTWWYAERCKEAGIPQYYDSRVAEYRTNIYDMAERLGGWEKTLTVICSVCGTQITGDYEKMTDVGTATCGVCGHVNKIRPSLESKAVTQPPSGSQAAQEAGRYVKITCSGCEKEFEISESNLISGQCYCPECGMDLSSLLSEIREKTVDLESVK